jgi:sulfopyruvate decarboxylase subunit beta
MRIADCFPALQELRNDELVVCSAGTGSGEWYGHTRDLDRTFYLQASMGMASMFALGMAVSLPQAEVWVLDGDGALVMNPGALLTEAEVQPRNMVHFVLANRGYGATGSLPYANAAGIDFVGLASACGIDHVYSCSSVDEVGDAVGKIRAAKSYALVVLELEAEKGQRYEIPLDGPEHKYRFARGIEQSYGVEVFNEWGY